MGVPKLMLDLEETLSVPLTPRSLSVFPYLWTVYPIPARGRMHAKNTQKNYSSVDIQLISAHSQYTPLNFSLTHPIFLTSVLIMPDEKMTKKNNNVGKLNSFKVSRSKAICSPCLLTVLRAFRYSYQYNHCI